eukprot:3220695-Rhodomonas_salina.1
MDDGSARSSGERCVCGLARRSCLCQKKDQTSGMAAQLTFNLCLQKRCSRLPPSFGCGARSTSTTSSSRSPSTAPGRRGTRTSTTARGKQLWSASSLRSGSSFATSLLCSLEVRSCASMLGLCGAQGRQGVTGWCKWFAMRLSTNDEW